MNIDKQTFNTLDVLYDDKKWGKRIDPDEWNANFKVLEEGHNELAQKLNQQIADIDVAVQAATSGGGHNINVQYGEGTETLQGALDNVVSDINNRYTKNEVDATVGSNTNSLLANAEYNESTGVFTFTRKDGSKIIFDTVIEKVPASMALKDEPDGSVSLVITNQDGSTTKTNVTSLIEDTVINSSSTINATSVTDAVKKVTTYTLVIKPNSIGLSHIDSALTARFEEAQSAKTAAIQAKDNAVAAQNAAIQAKNSAETYASNANTYSTNASASANESADSALEAKGYAEQAASYKNSAELAKTAAIQAKNDSETAKTDAQTFATEASKSETAAEQSAISASQSASSASQSETNASNSATSALQSKEAAALSEVNSLANKNASAKSASSAATSETNAASSALAAQTAQTAAEKARDDAQAIAGGDYATKSYVDDKLTAKVDKVSGKQLSTEDYTTAEKNKLSGIAAGANNYTHPSTHAATMITQDSTHRFVTDAEKSSWNTNEVFIATYGTTTNSEIEAAWQSGKSVFCKRNGYLYMLTYSSDNGTMHIFSSVDTTSVVVVACSSNTWSLDYSDLPPKIGDTDIGKVLTVDSHGSFYFKDIKPTITTMVILASNWDLDNKIYDFESTYPSLNYDIEVALDGDNATDEQINAWTEANMLSSSSNKIIAKGTIPTVDIPIILTVISK